MIYKIATGCIGIIMIMAFTYDANLPTLMERSVISVLEDAGADYSAKKANMNIKGVSAEVGRSIIEDGFAQKPGGGTTGQQSKHFVCTSCHNIQREDPDLTKSDPDARLDYVADNEMPYLQATTLYGAINRDTYYNGDYYKKYGNLVDAAKHDVRGAIQLCAVECAQGRSLEEWEVESVLAYLWTIDLQMSDLNLQEDQLNSIEQSLASKNNLKETEQLIRSKYLSGSPATFVKPPEDRKEGNGLEGDPKRGLLFYEQSCLHCHKNGKYSFLHLDDHKITHKFLNRKADGYSRQSIYQVTRWGVPPKSGKRSYMSQYTAEKMSEQQLADLRAYISERAE